VRRLRQTEATTRCKSKILLVAMDDFKLTTVLCDLGCTVKNGHFFIHSAFEIWVNNCKINNFLKSWIFKIKLSFPTCQYNFCVWLKFIFF
jgi:hypothetical protein